MRGFQRFAAGLTLVALVISLCSFVPLRVKAEVQTVATMSGLPETLLPGEQATVTLNLQNTPSVEYAMVQLELGEGLTLVSATWLVDGLMKAYDKSTNMGVLAFSGAQTMNGDVVRFVVEGAAAGEQTIKAGFEFRVGSHIVGTTGVTESITIPGPVASMSGLPETLLPGEQATVTLNLQNTPSVEFAMVQLELGEGLTLVSATWLVDGLMKDFDKATNVGVLAFSGAQTLDGDVMTFVVEGAAAGEQEIKANFEFRVGANTIGTTDVAETVTVPEVKTASGTFSGLPSQLGVGETATITVNLQDMPDVEFAFAQITLGENLELVSAAWLVDGVITDFDMARLRGTLAMENATNINGDVFQFVVRSTQLGLDQMVKIYFSFKVNTTEVCIAEVNQSVDVVDDKTISFLKEDGSVFHQVTVGPNDPIEMPEGPAKAADNTCTYIFKEWVKVDECTYKASYTATYIDYTVKFLNEDGSVISEQTYHYGDTIVVPAEPTKAADNTYTYAFAGWDAEVVPCAGDAVYTATYSKTYMDYTVKFLNADGSVISEQTYHYGDTIVVPAEPTKAADNTYTYAFAGWDSQVVTTCAGSATYIATYSKTYIEYTVTFRYENGTVISTATYHYGNAIVAPKDPESLTDGYAFAGWDKEIGTCDGNMTFTAKFERSYVLGDINDDGVVTDKDAVYLLYHIFLPEQYPVNQDCDLNGDGVVTDKDAAHLLYHTFSPEKYPLH